MKIICIGRNYAAHASEIKSDIPVRPVFFLKPETALLPPGAPLPYPAFTSDLQYETELVIRICKQAKRVDTKEAGGCYNAIATGFDFTARDIQRECKQKSLPWEKAKAFDCSAAIGDFVERERFETGNPISFRLEVNGRTRQQGLQPDMLFSFEEIISAVSEFITLEPGDAVFTGTPEGVGSVHAGDCLESYLNGDKNLTVDVLAGK